MNINVNMNGKEYLEYREKTKFKLPKLTNKNLGALIIIGSCLGLLLIPVIHETFNPPSPLVWGFSNLWGVSVHNALIVWFAIAIGIAWVVHGFGFIIVRG